MTQETNFELAELLQKNVLTFKETVAFTGFAPSYLYKLTHAKKIPHSKPTGKMIFFKRAEIENWLMSNPVTTANQIEKDASTYIATNKKGGML